MEPRSEYSGGKIKSIDTITKSDKKVIKTPAVLGPQKEKIRGYNLLDTNKSNGGKDKTEKKHFWNRSEGDYKPSFWHNEVKIPQRTPDPLKKAEKEKKKAEKAQKKASDPRTPKQKFVKILVGTLEFIIFGFILSGLIFSGAVYAYKDKYGELAMYGTKLLGEDVGGKTESEIQTILERKIAEINFSFRVDGQEIIVKPEEAGIKFNTGNTAHLAVMEGKIGPWYRPYMHASSSLAYRVYHPLGEKIDKDIRGNLSMDYVIDEAVLAEFTQGLSTKFNVESQNAGLVMQGTEVQVIPAKAGRRIVTESVKMQIADALKNVKTSQIKIDAENVNPGIIEEDTKESIAAAKKLLLQTVSYHYQGQVFTPDKVTIAKWITFKTVEENGKQKLVPLFEPGMIYPYIFGLAGQFNVPAVNKKVTVTNGGSQTVDQEGKDGLKVDVDQASVVTAQNLNAGKNVSLELPTYVVKSKTQVNNIVVADWSKYIEVNLSTQTMTAYTAGGVVVGSWAITSGASSKGYATPTGTFLIQRKAGEGGIPGASGGGVCMPNPPSSTPLCGINYVSYFTGQGHAIHEAWWRSPGAPNDFGNPNYRWNGSHGCVNATFSSAQFIFYWAPIGTPVIIHY